MKMKQLEMDKFTERLDFAIELLNKKFPAFANSESLMQKSVEIAVALFVRSEIGFNMANKKE